MGLIVSKWQEEDNVKKGKLVRVELSKGRYVKMYEQDAIAKGLLPGKLRDPGENKMRPVGENKATKPLPELREAVAPADDFTTIPGIGPASARALAARGITTFAQLRTANVAFLSAAAKSAIERWRDE